MIHSANRVLRTAANRLWPHLTSIANEMVLVGRVRQLSSEPQDIRKCLFELAAMTSHGATRRPLYHWHADPPPDTKWTQATWKNYWKLVETEFGLEEQPFVEVAHAKRNRRHVHRVYSLVRLDGKVISTSHDFARREKIARLVEIYTKSELTTGRHNRAVIAALKHEQLGTEANILEQAGLPDAPRPAAITPRERQQCERGGVKLAGLANFVKSTWDNAQNGLAFAHKLQRFGLRLARGRRAIVLVDRRGSVFPLRRILSLATTAARTATITARAIAKRLSGLLLGTVDRVKRTQAPSVPRQLPASSHVSDPSPKLTHALERRAPAVGNRKAASTGIQMRSSMPAIVRAGPRITTVVTPQQRLETWNLWHPVKWAVAWAFGKRRAVGRLPNADLGLAYAPGNDRLGSAAGNRRQIPPALRPPSAPQAITQSTAQEPRKRVIPPAPRTVSSAHPQLQLGSEPALGPKENNVLCGPGS